MARGVGGEGPANIMKHMKGIDFPVDKNQLIDHAKNGEGPDTDQVVNFLERLPEREYSSAADVAKAVGEVDRGEADHSEA